jgi:1,4-dihydroxy-2-naphthoyl-CoA hydrolase
MVTAKELNDRFTNRLPGLIGMKITGVAHRRIEAELEVREELLAPNGYLHGASVVALADTACGCGTIAHLPQGAKGFTTIELKCNFLGTVREGDLACEARLEHEGRRTHVWDAVVKDSNGRPLALFRCTQMILW